MQLPTPVAMIVFNRPEHTRRVFDAIAQQKPGRLLIVADGPRPGREGEAEKCRQVREIVSRVDWPCEVQTNFSETNLGCRRRVSSGITWVFEQVEEAIILEDDCLPDPSFFRFCSELLERYRNEPRMMHITGDNFQGPQWQSTDSYYFSRYSHIWGWATWRRAWKLYDVAIPQWEKLKSTRWLGQALGNPREARFWAANFESVYSGGHDTWDYQWFFTCLVNGGLTAVPSVNLVTNIGFGHDATHTTAAGPLAERSTAPIPFPLIHPMSILRSKAEDEYIYGALYDDGAPEPTGAMTRAADRIKSLPSRMRNWAGRMLAGR